VSKPPKWFRSSPNLEVGDVVVFTKDGGDQKLGEVVWTVGRVVEAQPSRVDGKVRQDRVQKFFGISQQQGPHPHKKLTPSF
jgi:hypothetical protein